MAKRAWTWGIPAAALALALLGGAYALSTPRYALYRLGVAMQRHDVAAAEGYFDVERIADHAAEVIAADYLARQPPPVTAAEVAGRELLMDLAKRRLRPEVTTRVRAEIRRNVERAGSPSTAFVLPAGAVAVFRAFAVAPAGADVWVTYQDPAQGPIRFRMSRQGGGGWRISEFDPEWVRRRAEERPPRLR
jgi:hypothetical protein